VREGVPDDVGEMPRVSEGVREREPLPEAELLAAAGVVGEADGCVMSSAPATLQSGDALSMTVVIVASHVHEMEDGEPGADVS